MNFSLLFFFFLPQSLSLSLEIIFTFLKNTYTVCNCVAHNFEDKRTNIEPMRYPHDVLEEIRGQIVLEEIEEEDVLLLTN